MARFLSLEADGGPIAYVNMDHVTQIRPADGGGRVLHMADGLLVHVTGDGVEKLDAHLADPLVAKLG